MSVFLNNLDDFIAPSQACVNPLVASKIESVATQKPSSRITLVNDYSQYEFDEIATSKPDLIRSRTAMNNQKVATVSLSDCLACSGCVTSAETLLIQEQSFDKLLRKLEDKDSTTIVVIISPNSRASIADFLHISPSEAFLRIAAALKLLGITYVFDTASAGDIALLESRDEFLIRHQGGRKSTWEKPMTTTANSFTSVNVYQDAKPNNSHSSMYMDDDFGNKPVASLAQTMAVGLPPLTKQIPMLTSNCPGWICYAEKNSPQALPYVSTVKSPQQIIGTLIKTMLYSDANSVWRVLGGDSDMDEGNSDGMEGLNFDTLCILDSTRSRSSSINRAAPDAEAVKRVFVVSIQPCFDKKLEASRRDFYHSETDSDEVDMVLSTAELWELLEMQAREWSVLQECASPGPMEVEVEEEDGNAAKKIRTNPSDEFSSELVMMTADDENRSVAQSPSLLPGQTVLDFLLHLQPDSSGGRDQVETMFRCYSEEGESLVTAIDANAGSGGYTEYVFKYAAEKLYGISLWDTKLQYVEGRQGKNPDFAEIDINSYATTSFNELDGNGLPVTRKLKFARAYGFQNINSVMNKLKLGRCDFDFVEMMACPSGCNNGGGQIKIQSLTAPAESVVPRKETASEAKDRAKRVDATFHSVLGAGRRRPDDSPLAKFLYCRRRLEAPMTIQAMSLLHTRYHAVPKLEVVAPLATKW